MVEIVFDQAAFFKKIVDSLKGLVDDILFNCDTETMELQAMDTSKCSLVYICLTQDCFDTYKCPKPINLGFRSDDLTKILKVVTQNDTLRITCDGDNENIEMFISNQNEDKTTKYIMSPVEIQDEHVSIPEQIYKAKLTISSKSFNELVRNMIDIDDSVTIICQSDSVSFYVQSSNFDATTKFKSGLSGDDISEEVEVEVSESFKISYSLRYLKTLSSAAALSNRVCLMFSKSNPLLVEYKLENDGFIRFYLAPKIDDEGSE